MGRKPAKPGAEDRVAPADDDSALREAYRRIEAQPAPQRLLSVLERLFGGRKISPPN